MQMSHANQNHKYYLENVDRKMLQAKLDKLAHYPGIKIYKEWINKIDQ